MERRRFFRKSRLVYLGIVVLVVLLNVAAWNSSAFADWYIAHVFPIWVSTYGRVSGLFPFSVGEWLIVAGLVVAGAADVFIDTNLKVNGISDGAVSYSRVVRLLLQYYRYHPLAA